VISAINEDGVTERLSGNGKVIQFAAGTPIKDGYSYQDNDGRGRQE